jgi:cytochrome c heme-lyase
MNSDGTKGCPVHHNKNVTAGGWNPLKWFGSNEARGDNNAADSSPANSGKWNSGCPVSRQKAQAGGCPVKHESSTSPFASPASIEESASHAQTPQPDQRIPLSTRRVVSSIPRAEDLREEQKAPHQPDGAGNWIYPSEQQFYNAMRRKGWQGIDETTVPLVVRIHNAVNEKGWAQVRRWESVLHGNENPRLVRFMGRPKDMSPKAFINTYLLWYSPPFDRHDWYVDRGDGKPPRRYVIDFYNGSDSSREKGIISSALSHVQGRHQSQMPPPQPPSMYIDVRPALDSPDAFSDRLKMFFIDGFPGIYAAIKRPGLTPAPAAAVSTSKASESGEAKK